MTIVRLKGIKRFRDRHGKWRCYHRKTGKPIKSEFGSIEFFLELQDITETDGLNPIDLGTTFGTLFKEYKESLSFISLAERTKRDYNRVFFYLKFLNNRDLSAIKREHIISVRDEATIKMGRRFGNYVCQVLSIVFNWGIDRGKLRHNPAIRIRKLTKSKNSRRTNRPWSDLERKIVLSEALPHVRLPIALMMFTGFGPKDAVSLQKRCLTNGHIETIRSKTGEEVFWPVLTPLRMILDATPQHTAETLCATSRGQPWTQDGLQCMWQRLKKRLENEGKIDSGLTLYGLRHTLAVILREVGHDERTIADALGQRTIEMARHYARGADLRRKMHIVASSLDEELKARQSSLND